MRAENEQVIASPVGKFCWGGPSGKDCPPSPPYTRLGWAPKEAEKEGDGTTEAQAKEVRRTHSLSALFLTGMYKHLEPGRDDLHECNFGGELSNKVWEVSICEWPGKEGGGKFWGPQDLCLREMPVTAAGLKTVGDGKCTRLRMIRWSLECHGLPWMRCEMLTDDAGLLCG